MSKPKNTWEVSERQTLRTQIDPRRRTPRRKKVRVTTEKQLMAAYRRVLRLLDGFIENVHAQDADTLICNRRGTLMTWNELRNHISEALSYKVSLFP